MGILYMIILFVYVAVVSGIYMLVNKLKRKWLSRTVLAFFILLPTYDIIITKALLFYYCHFTEKEKVYKTVENPGSVYFENLTAKASTRQSVEDYHNMLAKMYLVDYHSLRFIEFYDNGKIIKYMRTANQTINRVVLKTNKPTSRFAKIEEKIYGHFINTIIYKYYDLQKQELLGYLIGYYGKIPNIFFFYSSPAADGGACMKSLDKQDRLIINLTKRDK